MRALRLQESAPAMWFRNLLVYRLAPDYRFDAEALEAALAEKPARPCASQELSSYGFVAPWGKGPDAPLTHVSQGFHLLAARKEERILPGSVVRDALKEKIEEIEADRKSTRLNSSHVRISYAVFCLKKKKEPVEN